MLLIGLAGSVTRRPGPLTTSCLQDPYHTARAQRVLLHQLTSCTHWLTLYCRSSAHSAVPYCRRLLSNVSIKSICVILPVSLTRLFKGSHLKMQKKTAPAISRVHNGFIIFLLYRPYVHGAIIGIIISTPYICIKFQQEPHPPVPSTRQLHHHRLVLRVAQRGSAGGGWEVLGWTGPRLPGGGEAHTHTHTHTLDFTLLKLWRILTCESTLPTSVSSTKDGWNEDRHTCTGTESCIFQIFKLTTFIF